MAFSTSPYQQNDYQAASQYRPYELPVNDILKGLDAQNRFWDAGAARIKQVYENSLNLKLSLAPNQQIRDQFIQDSEKQLDKLSKMNVADPSVQRQGMNIFKPLLKDEGIIYDDAMTRHFDKVREDALRYREEDNGKGFNENNFRYAMDGYDEFVNSQDRMAGKKFYQKRKEYTPYYDPTSELTGILKNCGKDSFESQSPYYDKGSMTGYASYDKNASLSAQKVNGCLGTMLSEKGRRQLQIDGYVKYKNNPDALAAKYTDFANTSLNYMQKEYDKDVVSKLAAYEARLKKGDKLNDNENNEYETYKAIGKSYNDQIGNYKQQLQSIANGDYSFLNDNFEQYAGAIHMNDIVGGWSEAASYNNISKKMIDDPVQLTHIKYNQALNLQNDRQNFERDENEKDRQHDMNKAMLEWTLQGMGGNGRVKKNADGTYSVDTDHLEGFYEKDLDGDDVIEFGQKEFHTEKNAIDNQIKDVNTKLLSELRKNADFEVTLEDGTKVKVKDYVDNHATEVVDLSKDTFMSRYLQSKGADPAISNLIKTKNALENKQRLYINRADRIEEDLKNENPTLFSTEYLKGISSVKVKGEEVTPADVANALSGRGGKLQIVRGDTISSTTFTGPGMSSSSSYTPETFYLNGKELSRQDVIRAGLNEMAQKVRSKSVDVDKEIQSKRDEKFRESNFELRGYKQISAPNKNLQTILDRNLTDEEKKTKNVQQVSFDGTGNVIVQVNGMEKKDAAVYLKGLGIGKNGAEPKSIGNGKFIIPTESFYKVDGTANESDGQLVKLLQTTTNNKKLLNPNTPVGSEVDSFPQSFMGRKGLITVDVVVNKDIGGSPSYDLYVIKDGKRTDRLNRSGSIMDPNMVLQMLNTYQSRL